MSNYQEGCSLTLEEIAAILSLAGKEVLVGFQPDRLGELTPEKLISACCGLMQDQMMTCVDGKFRLRAELVRVMENLYRAGTVLAVMPSDHRCSQVIYYVADHVTAVEMQSPSRYILTPMSSGDIPGDLCERMDVQFPEKTGAGELPRLPEGPETESRVLLKDARFLVERLDPATGRRQAWLRLIDREEHCLLQWNCGAESCLAWLTEQSWAEQLQRIWEGECET